MNLSIVKWLIQKRDTYIRWLTWACDMREEQAPTLALIEKVCVFPHRTKSPHFSMHTLRQPTVDENFFADGWQSQRNVIYWHRRKYTFKPKEAIIMMKTYIYRMSYISPAVCWMSGLYRFWCTSDFGCAFCLPNIFLAQLWFCAPVGVLFPPLGGFFRGKPSSMS